MHDACTISAVALAYNVFRNKDYANTGEKVAGFVSDLKRSDTGFVLQ